MGCTQRGDFTQRYPLLCIAIVLGWDLDWLPGEPFPWHLGLAAAEAASDLSGRHLPKQCVRDQNSPQREHGHVPWGFASV